MCVYYCKYLLKLFAGGCVYYCRLCAGRVLAGRGRGTVCVSLFYVINTGSVKDMYVGVWDFLDCHKTVVVYYYST